MGDPEGMTAVMPYECHGLARDHAMNVIMILPCGMANDLGANSFR